MSIGSYIFVHTQVFVQYTYFIQSTRAVRSCVMRLPWPPDDGRCRLLSASNSAGWKHALGPLPETANLPCAQIFAVSQISDTRQSPFLSCAYRKAQGKARTWHTVKPPFAVCLGKEAHGKLAKFAVCQVPTQTHGKQLMFVVCLMSGARHKMDSMTTVG